MKTKRKDLTRKHQEPGFPDSDETLQIEELRIFFAAYMPDFGLDPPPHLHDFLIFANIF